MKKMIQKKVTNVADLPECWVVTKTEEADYYELVNSSVSRELPKISKIAIPLLKKLNIDYREVSRRKVEYWDPTCEEYEKLELPVYMQMFNEYVYQEHMTGELPSKKMIEAAKDLERTVKEEFKEFEREEKIKTLRKLFKESFYALVDESQLENLEFKDEEQLRTDKNDFFIFKLYHTKSGDFAWKYIVFDWYKIYSDRIEIEVPGKYKHLMYGRNNVTMKKMKKRLGISSIKVNVSE